MGESRERIPVTVYDTSEQASEGAAAEVARLIREKASRGERAVLGLATGSTPIGVYEHLVRLHREQGLSFANVETFNLDEYHPMAPEDIQSYRRFMREHLFDHVDIDPTRTHLPDGSIPVEQVPGFCEGYERRIREAGGIDLQILGIGRTGHIGFNEPGSSRQSRTRLITLDRVTRRDAASDFFGEWNVPRKAITMGVGTILEARRILLLAFGEHKAAIVARAVEGEMTPAVAASFLQRHAGASFVLDTASAAELTRFRTPWALGAIEQFGLAWDERTTRKAVLWLARLLDKPILKLTEEDFNEHGLGDLLAARGGAYEINLEVFRSLQRTITGWPGGKPGRDEEYPKRIVVFSPHPDDDVISMGGTFIRLCEQGHEVHVAYQTSGSIAVWDEAALRHVDFVSEVARAFPDLGREVADRIEASVEGFIRRKRPGEIDTPELSKIKALIRRTEARAAARYSGVSEDRIHFLDMPFYETGRVRKRALSADDIEIIAGLLRRVRPHQVYAAGDLSDPHGTHRVCLKAITRALGLLANEPWMGRCEVWLYRGAWQEWGPEDIEMAVPLSPEEVSRKRTAIFKHESQKDRALFPGSSDDREFWERAEDRNRGTANVLDRLGLAEYEAVEGFVRWKPEARAPEGRRHALTTRPMCDRLAVCSWSLRPSSPAELAELVRACGLSRVQLHLDPIREGRWSESETVARLGEAGLDVASGMMSMKAEDYSTLDSIRITGGVRPDEAWPDNLAAAKANARLAERLGIRLVTFHAGFLPHEAHHPERRTMVFRVRTIAQVFAAHGVRVALETGQEDAKTLLAVLDEINAGLPETGCVRVNFDPANMILYGMGDPIDALRRLRDHVAQAHVKDAVPTKVAGTWGTEVRVGTGKVDWRAFLSILNDLDADLVLEREAGSTRVEDVRAGVDELVALERKA